MQISKNRTDTTPGTSDWFTGSVFFFEPGEDHWHGAAPARFMTHLAMLDVDDAGNSATWGAHVTDAEYGAAPSVGEA